MTRRRWTVVGGLLLVVLVCAGAVFLTSRRARRPVPEVSLEGGGLQVEGQLAGGCVVEMLPPRFEPAAFVALPPGGGYEVVLAGPRPDEIGITVYEAADGRPGASLASTGLMPAARRSAWQPPQEAGGDIIMEVYAGRGDSDCWLFWFPLTLE